MKIRTVSLVFGSLVTLVVVALMLVMTSIGGKTPLVQAQNNPAVVQSSTEPLKMSDPVANVVVSQVAPATAPVQIAPAQAVPARTITVNALGQIMAAPDQANLSVGSEISGKTAKEALDKAKAQSDLIKNAILKVGIEEKDIRTSGVNAYPINNSDKNGVQLTGEPTTYRAYLNLNITIHDLTKAGAVLDAATTAGANQVGGLSYSIKDDSTLRAQALEQAVKQAKPKADAIARGLGLQVGQVISVVEDANYYSMSPIGGSGKGAGDAGINAGELSVSVRVTITYLIAFKHKDL